MRALLGQLRAFVTRVERSGLAVHELTVVLPLAPHLAPDHTLAATLRDLDARLALRAHTVFDTAPGLHSARLLLLDLGRDPRAHESAAGASGPLVMQVVYDGALDPVLDALLQPGGELLPVLGQCRGFPAHDGLAAQRTFLARARVAGGYLFSDVAYDTREEVDAAAALWRRFRDDFYVPRQGCRDAAKLREELASFLRAGAPTPLDPRFEARVPSEERTIRRLVSLSLRQRAALDPHARAQHHKAHGLVTGTLSVRPDLPEPLRVGLFASPRDYPVLLRPSNASAACAHDGVPDARGLALKVLGVEGPLATPDAQQHGLPELEHVRCQDFILLSEPTFLASDVRDFARLFSAFSLPARERSAALAVYFARRPRALRRFLGVATRRIGHPLAIPYFGVTPALLGDLAVKFRITPCTPLPARAPWFGEPSYLRERLAHTLSGGAGITLTLSAEILRAGDARRAVEDACLDWSALGSELVELARIAIPPQQSASAEAMSRAARIAFSPWHALAAHKPLGSLNRARRALYAAQSAARHGAAP